MILIITDHYCTLILTAPCSGCHILLPAYLVAIRKLLMKKHAEVAAVSAPEAVRAACIRLLAHMVVLPQHFDTTELRHCPSRAAATGSPRALAHTPGKRA